MKTVIQLEIDHSKALPSKTPVTDVIAQRLYSYLYSQGIEAGVTAKLMLVVPEPKKPWEVGVRATVLEQKESV